MRSAALIVLSIFSLFSYWNILAANQLTEKNPEDNQIVLDYRIDSPDFPAGHRFNVLHYKLELDLYNCFVAPYPSSFTGKITITVEVDSVLSEIMLDAVSASLVIDSVSGSAAGFTQYDSSVTINLDREYQPGEQTDVVLFYRHLDVDDNAFFVSGGLVFTDCIAERSRNWYPCWDKPLDKATHELIAAVPPEVELGSIGSLADSTVSNDTLYYHWLSRDPATTYLFAIIGYTDYLIDYSEWVPESMPNDTIPIRLYYKPNESVYGVAGVRDVLPQVGNYFCELFGDYPFEKIGYATLNSLFEWGGMENQTMISLCSNCWDIDLAVHEFGHMWFGDAISPANWAEVWLNEGFATYLEALWMEEIDSYYRYKLILDGNAFRYFLNNPGWALSDSSWIENPPSNDVLFDYSMSYMKASCVLHQLRYVLGDSLFFDALYNYAVDPGLRHGNATTRAFNDIVNQTAGDNYDWFFNQWIYYPNHPVYNNIYTAEYDSAAGNYKLMLEINQVQTNAGFFKMPLEFLVTFTDGSDSLLRVMNDSNGQQYEFRFLKEIDAVDFDPAGNILLKKGSLTAIEPGKESGSLPGEYRLHQNYPNPFNPATKISFELPSAGEIKLAVYNALGEQIAVLAEGFYNAGIHYVTFDAGGLPSGIYIVALDANNKSLRKKMTLLK